MQPFQEQELRRRIFKAICGYSEHIGAIDKNQLTESSNLNRDLNLDSLDRLQLFAELEDEFCIEISDENFVFKAETVKGIIDYIVRNFGSKIVII